MKKISYTFILFLLLSCNNKIYKDYRLYKRDKTINYLQEKLRIRLVNDTIGLFINDDSPNYSFQQRFVYEFIASNKPAYIIIKKVDRKNADLISLTAGDTIIIDDRKLHFFYNGEKKYFLSFK